MGTPGGSFSYAYNTIGQLTGLTNSLTGTSSQGFAFAYQPNGWLSGQTLDSKASVSYGYDGVGRLTDLSNRLVSGNTLLTDFGSLSYDSAGNRTGMTVSSAGSYPYTGSVSYAYSASQSGTYGANTDKDQLVSEVSGRAGATYNNAFGYDPVGNVTSFKGLTGIGYNNANEISALSYDQNGNPATAGPKIPPTNLTWDANDQIITAGTLTAGYDVFGRRAWKHGGNRTYFVYDEQAGVPVCEVRGDGVNAGTVTATNTWGVAGLLSRFSSGTKVLYTFDPQGSVAQRLNGSSGAVLTSHITDAYGTQSVTGSPGSDPYAGFGGQWGYYKDVETNLHLLGARYFDTSTGRFINRDPSGYSGGINLFAYCGNNPLSRIDPTGNSLQAIGVGVAIGVGTVVLTGGCVFCGVFAGGLATAAWNNLYGESPENSARDSAVVGGGIGLACEFAAGGGALAAAGGAGAPGEMATAAEGSALSSVGEGGGGIGGSLQNCFVAGTPVYLADGTTKPIEQVKAGDQVLSKDQHTSADKDEQGNLKGVTARKVVRTFVHEHARTLTLRLEDGETITTTLGHPFFVEGKGWTLSGQLAIGNAIVTRAGPAVKIVGIEHSGEATVYNFEVEQTHTYFIGMTNGGMWVHNNSVVGPFPDFDAARRAAFDFAGMSNPEDVTPAMEDASGTAVEFKGSNGAKVNYDWPHEDMDPTLGHDLPHVGVQFPGKRYTGGGQRYNFTYHGPWGPGRP